MYSEIERGVGVGLSACVRLVYRRNSRRKVRYLLRHVKWEFYVNDDNNNDEHTHTRQADENEKKLKRLKKI